MLAYMRACFLAGVVAVLLLLAAPASAQTAAAAGYTGPGEVLSEGASTGTSAPAASHAGLATTGQLPFTGFQLLLVAGVGVGMIVLGGTLNRARSYY